MTASFHDITRDRFGRDSGQRLEDDLMLVLLAEHPDAVPLRDLRVNYVEVTLSDRNRAIRNLTRKGWVVPFRNVWALTDLGHINASAMQALGLYRP